MESNALAGADIIDVPGGTYTLSIEGRNEDASVAGDLDVTDDLTINGPGEADTIIDADGIDRVLHIIDAITEMSDMTVTGGNLPSGFGNGAGILNDGTAILTNCTISNNEAAGEPLGGGGILNNGIATMTNRTISGNVVLDGGKSAVDNTTLGLLTMTNCTISGNEGTSRSSGLENNGIATLTNCTISNNEVGDDGGGIRNFGTLELAHSIVANNTSGRDCVGAITSYGQKTHPH